MDALHDKEQLCPVLVIAYDERVLAVLAQSLAPFTSRVEPCASFCAAESIVLQVACQGVLVDLTAMIKAKSEEKIVAYTLASFFPTLRVRAMGPMIVPMALAGEAKQEKSLGDFITRTCAGFAPRRLRRHKRRAICLPTFLGEHRGFTLNISWGGAFLADMNPERFCLGDRLVLSLPDFGLDVEVEVARIQLWGAHRPPGIGVSFVELAPELEKSLRGLLQSSKDSDHDRQVT
jgi:hypothetical protein